MGVIIIFCFIALTVTALIALLTKDRKTNSQQTARKVFIPPPLMGTTNPRKSGLWYSTNWYAGEKSRRLFWRGKNGILISEEGVLLTASENALGMAANASGRILYLSRKSLQAYEPHT